MKRGVEAELTGFVGETEGMVGRGESLEEAGKDGGKREILGMTGRAVKGVGGRGGKGRIGVRVSEGALSDGLDFEESGREGFGETL